MGKIDGGLTDLYHAQKARMTEEHDVIDQAVKDRGKGYSVFSIPPSVLFRPPENRLRQLQGTDMFAVVDQLAISQKKPIKRNNSILLPELRKKKSDASLLSKSSMASYGQPQSPLAHQQLQKQQIQQQQSLQLQMQHQYQQQQQQSCSPIERRRMDTGFSTYHSDDSGSNISLNSNYRVKQDGRRVDSGFESSHEERYSASSTSTGRSSTRSFKTNLYSPPPVPPIPPQHHFNTSEDYDLSSNSYGDFDQELEEVYGSLHTMSVQDREKDIIRSRLNSNNIGSSPMDRRESTGTNGSVGYPQPSVSTSTTGSRQSNQGKLKIKIHYTDTRILLVSSSIMFDELRQRVREKFGAPPSVRLQYKDEDSEMVLMIDDDDLYMARQISRNHNSSDTGIEKMEMWCVDAS